MMTSGSVDSRREFSVLKYLHDHEHAARADGDEREMLAKVKRESTGEMFLIHRPAPQQLVDSPLVGAMVRRLLNHENLVSIAGVMRRGPSPLRPGAQETQYLVWDHCDVGTLAKVFTDFKTPDYEHGAVTGYLPPSMCWHVLVSLLRALAWLHDGYREDQNPFAPASKRPHDDDDDDGEQGSGRSELRWTGEPEWLPVLHRNIVASNIFFQTQRGAEFHLCKLGDYSGAYVSTPAGGRTTDGELALLAPCEGDATPQELDELRKVLKNGEVTIRKLPKAKRPYTRGSELYAVGALLYRMMTGRILPDPEADECDVCGCRDGGSAPVADRTETCLHQCCRHARYVADILTFMERENDGGPYLLQQFTDYCVVNEWEIGLGIVVGRLLNLHRKEPRWPTWCVYLEAKRAWRVWVDSVENDVVRGRRQRRYG